MAGQINNLHIKSLTADEYKRRSNGLEKPNTIKKNMNFAKLYFLIALFHVSECNLFGNSIMKFMNGEDRQEYWQPDEVNWQRFITSPNCVFDDLLCALKITYRK